MYVFKDNADLREAYVEQKKRAEQSASRRRGLMVKFDNRGSLPAWKQATIETEIRHEGGIGYVRTKFNADCQEVSAWTRAIDMLDGVYPDHAAAIESLSS